jgi:hypothetical protein
MVGIASQRHGLRNATYAHFAAGGIYSEKEVAKDLVSRIPEQRSRSEEDYRGVERVVFRPSRHKPK